MGLVLLRPQLGLLCATLSMLRKPRCPAFGSGLRELRARRSSSVALSLGMLPVRLAGRAPRRPGSARLFRPVNLRSMAAASCERIGSGWRRLGGPGRGCSASARFARTRRSFSRAQISRCRARQVGVGRIAGACSGATCSSTSRMAGRVSVWLGRPAWRS
jgi:hypothetical protein